MRHPPRGPVTEEVAGWCPVAPARVLSGNQDRLETDTRRELKRPWARGTKPTTEPSQETRVKLTRPAVNLDGWGPATTHSRRIVPPTIDTA